MTARLRLVLALILAVFAFLPARAQTHSRLTLQTPAAARPGPNFDVKAATDAWLAIIPPDKKARSDAYFEGGYWFQLWDFLILAAIVVFLLQGRVSARIRDWAERLTSNQNLQSLLYFVPFYLLVFGLQFPMSIYEGYVREHHYGLSTQNFAGWFRDQAVGLAVGLILGAIAITILFAIVRHLGANWWVWGALASVVLLMFTALIAPVYIAPLFNTYTKLTDPKIKDPILSMARANGIPATDVYEVDESRQSNRVSANVSGFWGTERISLNDNLLKRCTPEEIITTMGHEMGHYVLNHIYKDIFFYALFFLAGFAFLNWSLHWSLARWGERWQIRGVTDVAVLPLAALLLALFFFVTTPIGNTWTRTQEYEADIFGLNAGRQPDGEAAVDLKLGDYRKLDPSPLEEFIFFDHPSGRTRITAAMRWKKENMNILDEPSAEPKPPSMLGNSPPLESH
ncbi:MAG TPA: M48 family metallopeptidase [Terriglobales bacterium]|nr:M48 family metallopeptidase [Terriglobales bacterium]